MFPVKRSGKQEKGFRSRMLLAMLFLLFNGVCVAAPVVKFSASELNGAVSTGWSQAPKSTETEGEQLTASSYVHQLHHFSFRRQAEKRIAGEGEGFPAALPVANLHAFYISSSRFLPCPGYYQFLFRYNLF